MPCSGADVRSDGSSVLSVPGPQDDPGNPARLTPSYYLLSGENPGSWGVCAHSSTTFLHRVIFGVLTGFRGGGRGAERGSIPSSEEALTQSFGTAGRRPVAWPTTTARTYVRNPNVTPANRPRIVMPMAVEGQTISGQRVTFR